MTRFLCWLIGWDKVEAAIRQAFNQEDSFNDYTSPIVPPLQ